MGKIRFYFDWKEDPVWHQDEWMDVERNGLPPICRDDEKLNKLMEEIVDEYASLFIDNSYEFTFVGFRDEERWLKFKNKVDGFIELLKKAVEPEYEVDTGLWDRDCKRLTLLKGEEV